MPTINEVTELTEQTLALLDAAKVTNAAATQTAQNAAVVAMTVLCQDNRRHFRQPLRLVWQKCRGIVGSDRAL